MSNLYREFRRLIPREPLQVGTVTAHNADGTSDVQLPGNQTVRARGQDVAIGGKAFVRAGQIEGAAPNLPSYNITV
ncbi:hypothetical protein RM530_04035 [Algiphilus sp. W345]|uniref:Uncharacterized protein n=1 Tax=Banduia mediterranea TaxID=3075609 RepID=A0ABU2WF87_9GAMM|nr:hypothetical protein [Algiphilus sp. W345]MDT0496535.1 hypothetical protein [Algiphilus sp. W345]